ncbi:ECF transporter S component [Anaerobacillus sp. MEB173]|uniref:ECF transporter S component n=1 Tax=Anaerobacillus sp. MEB173 TaxID=3383345 RepID=UPI003F90C1C9
MVKKTTLLIIFISLSVVGAMIKIPAIVGSVAFDSFPAVVAATVVGPYYGAIVALMGHLISAGVAGLPLGPFHLIIAVEMAFLLAGFGYIFRKGWKKSSYVIFVVGNAFLAPLPFVFLIGTGFYIALLPSLLVGTLFNLFAAVAVIPRLERWYEKSSMSKNGMVA